MGAYLSEPNVEKISDDGSCDELSYGASAMQGWRVGMEDAHNCIMKLTDDTSLFAVYDGHGGAEVAVYTAQQFPKLLTNLKAFKDGDIDAALEEAFMTFDASLKQKAIIEKLKRIAGMEESEEKEEDGETEALLEEAELPLEELVARYCTHPSKTKRAKLKQSHGTDLLSPMIQKKQPRFPLTAVNGSLQDGDGPVPNKTVPFDEEGDIVAKGKRDEEGAEGNIMNGPGGDNNSKENGKDNDGDDGEGVKVKKEEVGGGDAPENGDGSDEEMKEEAGASANSGSHNGDAQHGDTKEAGSSSGSSSDSKPKLVVPPYLNDDDDDDSDEEDADYQSGDDDDDEEDEEDDEEEDELDDDEDDEEEGNDDSGEFEGEEDDDDDEYRMRLASGAKEEPGSDSGSTAVVALLRGKTLTVANIGDSRCVLSREGKALDMSYDHKPEDDLELRRIEKAGGKVTPDGRVNGGLNLSRAFGDHCYKMTTSLPPEEQMISAFPDIQTVTLTDKDDFMVVACDGIWNAMTSQEVIDFVKHRLEKSSDLDQNNQLSKICEELFDFCLAPDTSGDGTGCDNMTCIIVRFRNDGADDTSCASVGSKRKSTDDQKEEIESKKPRH